MPRTSSVMLGSHWLLSPVPPMQGYTPLTAACRDGHVKIVKLLLKAGAAVDKTGYKVRG